MINQSNVLLSDVNKGTNVVLKCINAEGKIEQYLKNLGLVPGTTMQIMLNTINGTVVLVRNGKIALGRDISKILEVDVIDG